MAGVPSIMRNSTFGAVNAAKAFEYMSQAVFREKYLSMAFVLSLFSFLLESLRLNYLYAQLFFQATLSQQSFFQANRQFVGNLQKTAGIINGFNGVV